MCLLLFRSSDFLLFVKNGFVVGVRTLTVIHSFFFFFAKQGIRTWCYYTGIQDFPFQISKHVVSIILHPLFSIYSLLPECAFSSLCQLTITYNEANRCISFNEYAFSRKLAVKLRCTRKSSYVRHVCRMCISR